MVSRQSSGLGGCKARGYDRRVPRGTSITVQVEIPREILGDVDPVQVGLEMRRLWVIEQVRKGRIGVGKGAEVAGMHRARFMAMLGEHGVPAIDYPVEDLREELDSLARRGPLRSGRT
jgi:predicted HTH domain antitoxin